MLGMEELYLQDILKTDIDMSIKEAIFIRRILTILHKEHSDNVDNLYVKLDPYIPVETVQKRLRRIRKKQIIEIKDNKELLNMIIQQLH